MSLRDLERELGLAEALPKEASLVRVRRDARRYGKAVTVLDGFDDAVDLDALARTLKRAFATGGAVKGRAVELQGDHVEKARARLAADGFPFAPA